MRKLVHISDLHFGRIDEKLVNGLESKIHEISPDVIVVSGDLTQRARTGQFRAAAEFFDRLGRYPRVVVPGNHDIPLYNPVARFFFPFAGYARHMGENLEPVFEDDEIVVAGLNTADPYQIEEGRVRRHSVERLKSLFQKKSHKLRVLVSHHPLDLFQRGGRGQVPATVLRELDPDVLLAGHHHTGVIQSTAALVSTAHRSFLIVQGGTATSTRLRGEPNSFNLLELEADKAHLGKLTWHDETKSFEPDERLEFRLAKSGWATP